VSSKSRRSIGPGKSEPDDDLPPGLHRRMVTVAPDAPVAGVLTAMRRSATHLAVVEKDGASLGMVTLEAVLRAVVVGPPRGSRPATA